MSAFQRSECSRSIDWRSVIWKLQKEISCRSKERAAIDETPIGPLKRFGICTQHLIGVDWGSSSTNWWDTSSFTRSVCPAARQAKSLCWRFHTIALNVEPWRKRQSVSHTRRVKNCYLVKIRTFMLFRSVLWLIQDLSLWPHKSEWTTLRLIRYPWQMNCGPCSFGASLKRHQIRYWWDLW